MRASAREYPAYITALFRELEVTDKYICDLEARLEAARAAREGIKRQLDAYAITSTPVYQLPRELLLEIFQKWDGDQVKRNATLLFVCKAWNQLVMKAPAMWTDIRIECNRSLHLPMHFSYAEACVCRSAGLLLDISIRIIWLSDDINYEDICEDLLENATKDINHAVRMARAHQKWNPPQFCPSAPTVKGMIQFLLRILTGDDQAHMDRWCRFSLYTDAWNHETEAEIWGSMTGPTSNLLTLYYYVDGPPIYGNRPSAILGFPKLSAVRSFTSNLNIELATMSLPPRILTNLCLSHRSVGLSFMRHAASLFTALVKLDLTCGVPPHSEVFSTQVHVPRLQELRVRVQVLAPYLSCFDAPNLSYLELGGSIQQPLPSSDIFTRIDTFVWSVDPLWSTGPLRSVLVQTTLLVNFSVTTAQTAMEDNFRREIIDIKTTEGGLSHLKLVKYVYFWSPVPADDRQSSEKVGLSLDPDPHEWDEVRIIESDRNRREDVLL